MDLVTIPMIVSLTTQRGFPLFHIDTNFAFSIESLLKIFNSESDFLLTVIVPAYAQLLAQDPH